MIQKRLIDKEITEKSSEKPIPVNGAMASRSLRRLLKNISETRCNQNGE